MWHDGLIKVTIKQGLIMSLLTHYNANWLSAHCQWSCVDFPLGLWNNYIVFPSMACTAGSTHPYCCMTVIPRQLSFAKQPLCVECPRLMFCPGPCSCMTCKEPTTIALLHSIQTQGGRQPVWQCRLTDMSTWRDSLETGGGYEINAPLKRLCWWRHSQHATVSQITYEFPGYD